MTILIVDSSYLIYRSYFAYPSLSVENQPIGAFFGFVKAIISIIEEFAVDELVFAFDLPKPTWRHEILETYKAGRTPAEKDMVVQIPIVKDWCREVTLNAFENPGFEADDVIFTVCKQAPENSKILVLSSDRDLYQLLVDSKVSFLQSQKMGKYTLFEQHNLLEKYQVNPEQWLDYKALVGDSSDNLKGIEGVGPKTAAKILNGCGSLQNLLKDDFFSQNLAKNLVKTPTKTKQTIDVDQKWQDKITLNKEKLKQTYQLGTLQMVPDIQFEPKGFDLTKSLEVFTKYKFQSLINKINKPKKINPKNEQIQENLF